MVKNQILCINEANLLYWLNIFVKPKEERVGNDFGIISFEEFVFFQISLFTLFDTLQYYLPVDMLDFLACLYYPPLLESLNVWPDFLEIKP